MLLSSPILNKNFAHFQPALDHYAVGSISNKQKRPSLHFEILPKVTHMPEFNILLTS